MRLHGLLTVFLVHFLNNYIQIQFISLCHAVIVELMPPASSKMQKQTIVSYQCTGCKRFFDSDLAFLRHRSHFRLRGTACAKATERIAITSSQRSDLALLATAVVRRLPEQLQHDCKLRTKKKKRTHTNSQFAIALKEI